MLYIMRPEYEVSTRDGSVIDVLRAEDDVMACEMVHSKKGVALETLKAERKVYSTSDLHFIKVEPNLRSESRPFFMVLDGRKRTYSSEQNALAAAEKYVTDNLASLVNDLEGLKEKLERNSKRYEKYQALSLYKETLKKEVSECLLKSDRDLLKSKLQIVEDVIRDIGCVNAASTDELCRVQADLVTLKKIYEL